MKRLLYLHGFASSPTGRKAAALARLLPDFEIGAPDLNVPSFDRLDFDAIVDRAAAAASPSPDVLVGSSLGALVALAVTRRMPAAPLLLVAPALGFGARWLDKLPAGDPIPVFHYGYGREMPIHRRFFGQMARVDVDREPPAVPVTVIIGRHDESVPIAGVWEVWQSWQSQGLAVGRFVEIVEGDHGLTDFVEQIAAEARELTQ
jgi:uncharacterized protein